MKKIMLLAAASLAVLSAAAQAPDEEMKERLDSVIVSASRAGKSTPVTYSNVGKDDLVKNQPSASLPMS